MIPKLSIIMPCYNCERTLREAVDSCYAQGFSNDEFEIVTVDDGSTDGTKDLLQTLASEHSNINVVFHTENKGGGAARNTAVANTESDVIFCLDSDDVLPPDTLPRMVSHLHTNNCDGVLFEETRFFSKNTKKYTSVKNIQLSKKIQFSDLFMKDVGFLTQVNFMYTKKAFSIVGGYPVTHGFDTQTFGLIFLAKRLTVQICPKTYYYHRQNQSNHKSYYVREYERGLISINSYLALEPILDYLHPDVITFLMNYDIFQKNSHKNNQHLRSALGIYAQGGNALLARENNIENTLVTTYLQVYSCFKNEKFSEAAALLEMCEEHTNEELPLLQYMRMRIAQGVLGTIHTKIDDAVATELLKQGTLNRPKYRRIPSILFPVYSIYKKLFK